MQNVKSKLIFLLGMFIMISCLLGISVNAANEDAVIVKENESKYIIYLKNYLSEEFEFAFSNNNAETEENLNFINSALDKPDSNANNIAYVDGSTISMFSNPTYMWVRKNGEIKISAKQIDVTDNISKEEIENVGKTSQIIPIKIDNKKIEDNEPEDGVQKTTIVGIVKIVNEYTNIQYQLIKKTDEGANKNLFALAELIEKNEFTDMYTKLKANKEFSELYKTQYLGLENQNWKNVENREIEQPEDTENGDQYILWLKTDNSKDIHFLTSHREENEETIKKEITTILPYTYDNNFLVIALCTVCIAIIAVATSIVILKKKELKK